MPFYANLADAKDFTAALRDTKTRVAQGKRATLQLFGFLTEQTQSLWITAINTWDIQYIIFDNVEENSLNMLTALAKSRNIEIETKRSRRLTFAPSFNDLNMGAMSIGNSPPGSPGQPLLSMDSLNLDEMTTYAAHTTPSIRKLYYPRRDVEITAQEYCNGKIEITIRKSYFEPQTMMLYGPYQITENSILNQQGMPVINF